MVNTSFRRNVHIMALGITISSPVKVNLLVRKQQGSEMA